MKTLIFASSLVLLSATSAVAQNNIQDHYKDVIVQQPYSVEVCSHAGGNGKSELQNFLEGAIIGGAIGNNIPGESGGGAMGAFIGGILNNENNKNSGPRCRTETRYNEQRQRVYSHSTITFTHNGRQHTLRFNK
tara:strand:- start:1371 stop:1772 length:402 start_codon:yes stop_codon:yes gene_type:complete